MANVKKMTKADYFKQIMANYPLAEDEKSFVEHELELLAKKNSLAQYDDAEGIIVETIKDGKMNRVFSCCGEDFTTLTMWMTPKYCPNCGCRIHKIKEEWK